jgi:peptide-methionine (S)-S-oxide reductase
MVDDKEGQDLERATFGGGCFWGVEAGFHRVKGVVATAVGFMGGHDPDPTYMEVCEEDTGHTEVVQVIYYEQLVGIFFDIHDPTTLEKQGPDVGRQYRSVIFYHTLEQKTAAEKALARFQTSGRFRNRITTAIEPASEFYIAEEYHQQFFEKCGRNYCATPRNMEE